MRSAMASRAVSIRTGTRLPAATQPPADLDAVDVGHADVEHDRVGDGGRDLRERLLAALGHLHLVAGQRQRAAQGVAHGAIVVDDEDSHRPSF